MGFKNSLIIGWVGAKGNGKSLSMAQVIAWKLAARERVWSNMPVKLSPALLNRKKFMDGTPLEQHETIPLDWNLLYMLDESMAEGTVAIDEIGYYDDSRQTGSNKNRLINACIRQVRHRQLDILYTAKSFKSVDYRLRDETDVLVECEDLSYKPWGKENKVEGGISIIQRYYDLSGIVTGKATDYFSADRRQYKALIFHGRPYWDCYDTRSVISLEEAFTSVKLDLKERKITNKDSNFDNETRDVILRVLSDLKTSGKDRVPSNTLWDIIESEGIEGNRNQLARYLPRTIRRKNTRNGMVYDLSGYECAAV